MTLVEAINVIAAILALVNWFLLGVIGTLAWWVRKMYQRQRQDAATEMKAVAVVISLHYWWDVKMIALKRGMPEPPAPWEIVDKLWRELDEAASRKAKGRE